MLFHGSNIVVRNPEVRTLGHYKDFGYGFYCTRFEKQAKKWALTKNPQHIVTVFEYFERKGLNVLSFNEMTDAWLDFVANCRKGVVHKYDIVEGPMADDQIWDVSLEKIFMDLNWKPSVDLEYMIREYADFLRK